MEQYNYKYTCTALAGINKSADLEKDEHGYYRVLLAALNVYNHAGTYYVFEDSKHVFDSSSTFTRKMKSGKLHGERDHPPYEPGMSEAAWVERNEWIEISNLSHHIREVELVTTDELCNGLPVVEVWGWVKPDGEHAAKLEAALSNPHQNVCFSLRAIVKEKTLPSGQVIRKIDELITFDWVIEDGLQICNKYSSIVRDSKVAQESTRTYAEVNLNERVLGEICTRSRSGKSVVGQESHRVSMYRKANSLLSQVRSRPKVQATGITNGGW